MQPRFPPGFKIRHQHRWVSLALVAVALLQSVPLFGGLDRYGRRDWDQLSFRYEAPRVALLRDHQVPLWNPYVNGGNVLLAHPASPFPSPWYAPVLVMGARIGLRVQVVLFLALGALGAAALARRWGAPPAGGFVAGVIFMMSAHFSLHIAEGHLEWTVLGLMPWVVIGLLRGATDWRFVIATGLLLSSALMLGSVYIIAVYLPFLGLWSALEAARRRSARPLVACAGSVALMAALSSVKLLPQLEFARANPRPPKAAAVGLSYAGLVPVFLEPRQDQLYWAMRDVEATRQAEARGVPDGHRADLPPEVAASIHQRLRGLGVVDEWHEYGAYVTLAGLALALLGVGAGWRVLWPLNVAGALALAVVFSARAPVDLWAALQRLPLYSSLTVPSRFVAAVLLPTAMAAALGLGWLLRQDLARRRWAHALLAVGVPLVITAELMGLAWRLWGNIFVYPAAPLPVHERFATRYATLDTNYPGMYSYTLPLLAANSGLLQGYENLVVRGGGVIPEGAAGYRGEAYLMDGTDSVAIRTWTMSRVDLAVRVDSPRTLVLNQNWFTGWKAHVTGSSGAREQRALPGRTGLVTVSLYEGDRDVVVYYRPDSFVRGAWLSGIGWAASAVLLLFPVMRRRAATAFIHGAPTDVTA